MMKAWRCDDTRPIPTLVTDSVEPPKPEAGQILVRVFAAGVTPSELTWYPTTHLKTGDDRQHAIPGHEFAGVVAAIGDGVDSALVGQAVFGMNDWFADGATAEYCVSVPPSVAPKPIELTFDDAASIPIGALTAWQGLYDRAHLQSGEQVLIHGGAGAVGIWAIQLAARVGAHVVTTASSRHRDRLIELGAQQVIDYRTERFEDLVKSVDVVFDAVGGATLQRSWQVLSPRGRIVTIAASGEVATDERTQRAFFIVEPNQQQLTTIAELVSSNALRCVVDAVIPFDQAGIAYAGQLLPRMGIGKMVIKVD